MQHPNFRLRANSGVRLNFNRKWLWSAFLTFLAICAAAYAVLPMVLVLSGSLESEPSKIFSYWDPLSFRAFVPPGLSDAGYVTNLSGKFGTALLNSIIVSSSTVIFGLALSILAAFSLAILRFRFRDAVFALIVVAFLVPFDAVSIPLSGTFREWGLSNSLVGLVLPGLASGFAVFLLRQFFLGIPRELIDAARIDGMSNGQIILFICLPLARAAIIAAGLLLFLDQWQEYLWPLLTITSSSREVAPVALSEFVTQFSTDFRGMFASAVLTTALPLVLVLMLQRYFTQTVVGTEGK